MSRLGLLVNPTSGGGRGAAAGARALDALRREGHDVVPVAGPRVDPRDVAGLDALVVVGGDGTVHAGLQVTAGSDLPLGVVPAGSGDDVARSLGLPRRTDDALAVLGRALTHSLTHPPRRVDAVRVGAPGAPGAPDGPDTADGPARWYVGVLSCGFDAAVNARANAMTWPRGHARYLRGVVAELRTFAPYGYRITLDDAVWESGGTLVAAANVPRFGGGIRIAPDASMTDGLLDVVVAGPSTRRGVVAVLPGTYRGRHVRHPAVQVLRSRSVLVEADPHLGAPPPVAYADGERLGPLPVRATVVPGALAVLARAAPPGGAAATRADRRPRVRKWPTSS